MVLHSLFLLQCCCWWEMVERFWLLICGRRAVPVYFLNFVVMVCLDGMSFCTLSALLIWCSISASTFNLCLQEVDCLLGEGLGWQVKLAAWPRWLKMSSRHQVNGRPSLKCRLWFWRNSREWRLAPVQMLGTPMTWRLYYLSYLFSTDLYSCLWPLVGCLVLKPRLHPSLLPLTFLLPVCVPLSIHARRLRLDWLAHSSTGSFCLVLDPSLYSEQFFEIFEIFSALWQFLCFFVAVFGLKDLLFHFSAWFVLFGSFTCIC